MEFTGGEAFKAKLQEMLQQAGENLKDTTK